MARCTTPTRVMDGRGVRLRDDWEMLGFNVPLLWDTSSVTNMMSVFTYAFNRPLAWDTSSVTSMGRAFQRATAFDQKIGVWDTSKVTSMYGTFKGAEGFDRQLDWDTSTVTSMYG